MLEAQLLFVPGERLRLRQNRCHLRYVRGSCSRRATNVRKLRPLQHSPMTRTALTFKFALIRNYYIYEIRKFILFQ
jgi:hypothetical protein